MVDERVEIKAMNFVMDYEKKQGRNPNDVSKAKNRFKGFDIISLFKNGDMRTIEVKGTTKSNSIPDCFETNFTRTNRLVADYLYVVSFAKENPELFIIPSEVIKPEHLSEKIMIKFSSNFKTQILPKYNVKV